ncbi:P-loop containing nucleoside triphosphate hydrolase protein [Thamnocephalis sphaerospora]|uniref:P-loop containing nucleoside triphosphate hydrolase protein n=1 Tax=Thamnocephalis sphaerospora TaxID=78915 RepID=A0A4V1IX76_9FUNG|nr:P-loop containing nucleoside triphosphate hydrolase protein [Thamnocephalis sphaerospora]|eukprot:RKP10089.1 P-loop containing nucleoside triphosphate hydrolase protein [Thamnocephalis sphaerospora]
MPHGGTPPLAVSTAAAATAPPPGAGLRSPTRLKAMQVNVSRGVQCNIKVVIRGDKRTGKSTLFRLVQGLPFSDAYETTPQIQVENIQWGYNDSSDVVKVEFWDVVDQGIRAVDLPKDDQTTPPDPASEMLLDAETVNVYRGANAVVLLFDVTREETFEYACRLLPDIPDGIPILLLGNFSDEDEKRVVTRSTVMQMLDELCQQKADRKDFVFEFIRYAEASLKDSLGLDYLHRFLGVPFLTFQLHPTDAPVKAVDTHAIATSHDWDDVDQTLPHHTIGLQSPIQISRSQSDAQLAEEAQQRRKRQDEMLRHVSKAQWHSDDEETVLASRPLFTFHGAGLTADDDDDDDSPNPLVAADEDVDATEESDEGLATDIPRKQSGLAIDFESAPLVAMHDDERPLSDGDTMPSLDVLIHRANSDAIIDAHREGDADALFEIGSPSSVGGHLDHRFDSSHEGFGRSNSPSTLQVSERHNDTYSGSYRSASALSPDNYEVAHNPWAADMPTQQAHEQENPYHEWGASNDAQATLEESELESVQLTPSESSNPASGHKKKGGKKKRKGKKN